MNFLIVHISIGSVTLQKVVLNNKVSSASRDCNFSRDVILVDTCEEPLMLINFHLSLEPVELLENVFSLIVSHLQF